MMTFSPEHLALLQNAFAAPVPPLLPPPPAEQPDAARACQRPDNTLDLPLWPILLAYPLFACLLASVSLLAPESLLAAALVAAPALLVPLAVHAVAVARMHTACRALAAASVALCPLALWLARPWLLWAAAAVVSLFLALAAPRGLLGRASACSCALVLLSLVLLVARGPPRVVWGGIVLALTLQSVAATARLRNATLSCALREASV